MRLELRNDNANKEELDAFVNELNEFYKKGKNIRRLTSVIFTLFEIDTGQTYMMSSIANPSSLKKFKMEVKALDDITLGVKTQYGEDFMYSMTPKRYIQLILSRKLEINSIVESIALVLTQKESMAISIQSNI